jgi:hypothetical protein
MVIATAINTGTFGVAPEDAGVAAATVTVGQMLGGSVGTSLLNSIFASAIASYLTAHLASARFIGRQALTGLALAHGYDTAFWWITGTFAGGAVIGNTLLRRGPLVQQRASSPAVDRVITAQTTASPTHPGQSRAGRHANRWNQVTSAHLDGHWLRPQPVSESKEHCHGQVSTHLSSAGLTHRNGGGHTLRREGSGLGERRGSVALADREIRQG